MFTNGNASRWASYHGHEGDKMASGVPIHRCSMCHGTGRLVDIQEHNQALRAMQEREAISQQTWRLVRQTHQAVFDLLREDPEQAKDLAARVGQISASCGFVIVEESLRHNFLNRMRRLKEEAGAKVTWEDLRRIAVRLFPQAEGQIKCLEDWRAFRVACQRAQPFPGQGPRVLDRVFDRRKGWVYRWEPPKYLPDDWQQRKMGEMFEEHQREVMEEWLGKRLFRLQEREVELRRLGVQDDPVDGPVLEAARQLLQQAAKSRIEQGRNAPKPLDRTEQLLRIIDKRMDEG